MDYKLQMSKLILYFRLLRFLYSQTKLNWSGGKRKINLYSII